MTSPDHRRIVTCARVMRPMAIVLSLIVLLGISGILISTDVCSEEATDVQSPALFKYAILSDVDGNRTVELVSYYGNDAYIEVPSTVTFPNGEEYTVVSIGTRAFYAIDTVDTVIIPEDVSNISSYAFQSCSASSIVLGPYVTSIGEGAFSQMENLTSFVLPDGVMSIAVDLFADDIALQSVQMGPNVIHICDGAFQGCSSLKNFDFPPDLTEIGECAFMDCVSLTDLVIHDGVERVGDNAFWGCTSLVKITVPISLDVAGNPDYPIFEDCPHIREVYFTPGTGVGVDYNENYQATPWYMCRHNIYRLTLSEGITSIGNYTFAFTVYKSYFDLPASLVSIGDFAFHGSEMLEYVIINGPLESIGTCAFSNCASFVQIILPDSVTSLGDDVFAMCTYLIRVKLGNGITAIPDGAFTGCSKLFHLEICGEISSIGYESFMGCSVIESIIVPGTVLSLGSLAFCGCFALEKLEMNGVFGVIKAGTFQNCRVLETIEIPDRVVSIEASAFSGCLALKSIDIPDGLVNIGNSAFDSCRSLNHVELPDSLLVIGAFAFYGCSGLMRMTLPDGVDSIGKGAFHGCRSLEYLSVPIHLDVVGRDHPYIFSECTDIKHVTFTLGKRVWAHYGDGIEYAPWQLSESPTMEIEFSYGITTIPNLFSDMRNLTEVHFPRTLVTIEDSAFRGCESISHISFNKGLLSIGDEAFRDNGSLVSVDLPDSLRIIGKAAFQGCWSLGSVTALGQIAKLNEYTFEGCWSLRKIVLPASLTVIESYAIGNCRILNEVEVHGGEYIELMDKALYGSHPFSFVSGKTDHSVSAYSDRGMTQPFDTKSINRGFVGKVYFKWTYDFVAVTFNPAGGRLPEGWSNTIMVERGASIGELPVPKRLGSGFVGWFTDVVGGTAVTSDTTVTYDITLYAQWEANTYTITFMDGDDIWKVLEFKYGQWVDAPDDVPSKEGHTFIGWEPNVPYIMPPYDVVLHAKWDVDTFTIIWKNYDGTVLDTDFDVVYGSMPTYDGNVPMRPSTAQYVFEFAGWTPDISAVTCDMTYYADFTRTVRTYTIEFVNGGTVLQTSEVAYGDMPVYGGDVPARDPTAHHIYTFKGWSPEVSEVTRPMTYVATFTESLRLYTIQFVNGDTVLQTSEVAYGDMPVYGGDVPVRDPTAQYTYVFSGWDPMVSAVTCDMTYRAQFAGTVRSYTVGFVCEGVTLQSSLVEYGVMPVYIGDTPVKEGDGTRTYVFNGWSPEVSVVTGDATYIATFVEEAVEFTIRFVDHDGTLLYSYELGYGEIPAYPYYDPVREPTAQYTYAFSGWSPAIKPVEGAATYVATYDREVRKYVINFVDDDGTELKTVEIAYGAFLYYGEEDPVKDPTLQYVYVFLGWDPAPSRVTGDATYRATYVAIPILYDVVFVDDDGTVLQTSKLAYGVLPEYIGKVPTKTDTEQFTYEFSGWSPEVTYVTGDAMYTATYSATVREYRITFDNYDGTDILSIDVAYGDVPVYPGETPVRESTVDRTYTFIGWHPELAPVTGDATYTAMFEEHVKVYRVTFNNYDGKEIVSIDVAYGRIPVYPGDAPTRPSDAQYTYTFKGWDPEIVAVTCDVTYVATFTGSLRTYTVSFMLGDDVFHTRALAYGYEIIRPAKDPTLPNSHDYRFVFVGWYGFTEGMTVTGDVRFTAQFVPEPISYPEIVDGKVVLTVDDLDKVKLGDAFIDKTHEYFEDGIVELLVIETRNGTISLDKDSFFLFRSGSAMVELGLMDVSDLPEGIVGVVGDGQVYDISVGGHHNFGSGRLSISIDLMIPDRVVKGSLKVLHFDPSGDGSYEYMDYVYDGGSITFATNELSYFAVVYDTLPGGNDGLSPIIGTVIVTMIVLGLIAMVAVSRR